MNPTFPEAVKISANQKSTTKDNFSYIVPSTIDGSIFYLIRGASNAEITVKISNTEVIPSAPLLWFERNYFERQFKNKKKVFNLDLDALIN